MGSTAAEVSPDHSRGEFLPATVENMKRLYPEHGKRLIAVSLSVFEEFSANPGDYWSLEDSTVLRDSENEPCVLALRQPGFQVLPAEHEPDETNAAEDIDQRRQRVNCMLGSHRRYADGGTVQSFASAIRDLIIVAHAEGLDVGLIRRLVESEVRGVVPELVE